MTPEVQEQQFRAAASARGLRLPLTLVVGLQKGNIPRCSVDGKGPKNTDGAYLYNPGADSGVASGGFQNHTDGLGWQRWQADAGRPLTPTEQAALVAQREKDQVKVKAVLAKSRAVTARDAALRWAAAQPCVDHPYLTQKGVGSYGLRECGGQLLVPASNAKGVLTTLQTIGPDGTKRFLPGGKKKGSFYLIGTIVDGCTISIVEGYATGGSVHEATGFPVVVAFDSGNLLPVALQVRKKYPNHPLLFCGDDDSDKPRMDNPGRTAAEGAAQAVGGLAVFPNFGDSRKLGQTDFNDLHAARGLEAVKACIEQGQGDSVAGVKRRLARNPSTGVALSTPANLMKIIRHDPRWGARLSLNEMSREVCLDRQPKPDRWVHEVQELIQDDYRMNFPSGEIQAKLLAQASANPRHPVREYLSNLKWDGEARLERVPTEILGTEPNPLYSTYFKKFCVGAVRRVFQPGCKLDTVLTLVGPQGIYKSTFFQVLAGEFFNDSPIDMNSKDGVMVLHRAWISELAEIDHNTSNTAVERIKGFISSRQDVYRPPYSVSTDVHPRSCVLVGTSNREGYLTDPTGSRRFWTIQINKRAEVRMLREWRDQLWAEAVVLEAKGVEHWLNDKDEAARAIDSQRFESEDPWESKFLAFVERAKFSNGHGSSPRSEGLSIAALMNQLDIPSSQQTRASQMRLASILKRHGWEKGRKHIGKDKNKGPWLWGPGKGSK